MRILHNLLHYLNLDAEVEDFAKIHESIEKEIVFKGTNLWILIFAIIIASVGLNMNSTAVIIGAMLISPLMGPINGLGYSLATYNFPLFRKALKNFSFAVGAGLVASTAYFAISPVSTAHSELLARTSPTIYDVLIALFGGLAGIFAISSRQKGNVIPGVAIATALMPPLCTAGYGLATTQFQYFFGALYLFAINTVFIAISSVLVSQLLKFPITTLVKESDKKRVNHYISLIIAITVIPSIYFGYILVQKERFTKNASKFISNISVFEGNYLLKQEISASRNEITLIYGGNALTDEHKTLLNEKAKDFSLADVKLIIKQGFALNDFSNSEVSTLKMEINRLTSQMALNKHSLDSIQALKETGKTLLKELRSIYPAIVACSYSESSRFSFVDNKESESRLSQVVFSVNNGKLTKKDKDRIENWLKTRLGKKSVEVYYEEPR